MHDNISYSIGSCTKSICQEYTQQLINNVFIISNLVVSFEKYKTIIIFYNLSSYLTLYNLEFKNVYSYECTSYEKNHKSFTVLAFSRNQLIRRFVQLCIISFHCTNPMLIFKAFNFFNNYFLTNK